MVETNKICVFDSVLSRDKSTENPAKTVYSLEENRRRDDSVLSGKITPVLDILFHFRNFTNSFIHQASNFLFEDFINRLTKPSKLD